MSEYDHKKLTTKQRKALDALLAGAKLKDAATVAGVEQRTLHRWRQDKAFAFELKLRTDAATSDASRRLTAGLEDMLDVLEEVAKDKDAPRHVRVRAALGWLDRHMRLAELSEVVERIERLEKVVGA